MQLLKAAAIAALTMVGAFLVLAAGIVWPVQTVLLAAFASLTFMIYLDQ